MAAQPKIEDQGPALEGRLCDQCGDIVGTVRRVALDHGYDRLQKVHKELYSCSSCFEDKEKRRLRMGQG